MRYRGIIGNDATLWATPARAALRAAEWVYTRAVGARNRRYDNGTGVVQPPVPVISVGNITTGGTGKTPVVIDLVERLLAVGRNPVVVSRGYRARGDEPNDEQKLIELRCPGVVCLADPDRVSGVRRAHRACRADVVVLDDGFQHRRLGRQLDIVLIDASCPFGYGHVLPRGLLREPIGNLRRADLIVLTRVDQAAAAALQRIEEKIRTVAVDVEIIRCRHTALDVVGLDGSAMDPLADGTRAILFAGIANPEAFATTAGSMGFKIVGQRWWPDHHKYSSRDMTALIRRYKKTAHDIVLTTEKDAVKLAPLATPSWPRIGVVRVTIDFDGDDATALDRAIARAIGSTKP